MKKILKFLGIAIVIFGLIQLIPVNKANPPVQKTENFVSVFRTPVEVQEMLKSACYDCHSNETKYPDYAKIAPVSWAIKEHVNEGREHLNFSIWSSYNQDLKKNMLESTIADLQQNRMPLAGYMVYHPDANLSDAQKKVLIQYFSDILKSGKY
ncbi:MAG: heme-binding domain-containing protein [Bacteroidetes bacterium]|nr:heme-binding domain-containing protein [Bacteroidota bacterium]